MPLIRKDPPELSTAAQRDLIAALRAESGEERWSAARALAKEPQSATALGAALLIETDGRVREAMFTSLAHIQTADAVDAVLPLIRSPDAAIRTGALDALSVMPAAVADRIPSLLADPDPDVRLLVCDIVRRLPADVATQTLCDLLDRETVVNVCAAAVDALSEIGEPSALPALDRCKDRYSDEQFLAFAIQIASDRIGGTGGASGPQPS